MSFQATARNDTAFEIVNDGEDADEEICYRSYVKNIDFEEPKDTQIFLQMGRLRFDRQYMRTC